ncbi:MAG: hypothetical protein M1833_001045 [Piccolia ochrophora]|nr:MAG: hypothetical protein M1833_001045 [Piccolia ochrophora]
MQPGPSEATQSTSTATHPESSSPSAHHGLQDRHLPASRRSSPDGREELGSIVADEARSASSSSQAGEAYDELSERLSVSDTSSGQRSPVNRIAEHEKASSSVSKRYDDGPSFKVVKRANAGHGSGVSIAAFPNEVLTHVLSHLPATALSAMASVSRRFHSLVTTPHAWRTAFSRFFPGTEALESSIEFGPYVDALSSSPALEILPSEKRVFTRLTAFASWRSEYILRTQLLRSLARGKPAQPSPPPKGSSPRAGQSQVGHAAITYNSQLLSIVNHIHAIFESGSNKRLPRVVHGADDIGSACSSDPVTGKIDKWGFSDPQTFLQFVDRYPGDAEWGLGAGEIVGVPNVMDVSQLYGLIYGEGSPGGMAYFRSVDEMRGYFLTFQRSSSMPELGIPEITRHTDSVCAVWIAKSSSVHSTTDGVIGLLTGSSSGVLTAYSLGTDGLRGQRLQRGDITARWVLSPGVPIIAIQVDDTYTLKRGLPGQMWAVVLNALGEVYYLTSIPKRKPKHLTPQLEGLEWETGRSVFWHLIEPTRRIAKPDPYGDSGVDGSYTPRSSWDGMSLSKDQLAAETREVEKYMMFKPKHFQKKCEGWDMRRRLEVDFAGSVQQGCGQSVVVVSRGLDEGPALGIRRFTRFSSSSCEGAMATYDASDQRRHGAATFPNRSLFGGDESVKSTRSGSSSTRSSSRTSSFDSLGGSSTPVVRLEEWRVTDLSLGMMKSGSISTTAIDMSNYAVLRPEDDPFITMSGTSAVSSPTLSPLPQMAQPSKLLDIPGQRARLMAAGTDTGVVFIWNIRGPTSSSPEIINVLAPVRVIYTDSPQISCLALSALYVVHGGNDGLVQAWDPLASNTQPIRTINSRFSSRARRRLIQAEASPQGVGINLFAAGAICLDPDPTVLRGMVSLGTHLRYWSYSSTTASQYATRKRRVRRRSERGSNTTSASDRFSGTGRGALQDYIITEKLELEHEKQRKRREAERLAGRFGVGLLGHGESEEDVLAYARLLSEESFAKEDETRRRRTNSEEAADAQHGSDQGDTVMETTPSQEDADPDVAEAIRLSLLESDAPITDADQPSGSSAPPSYPIRYAKQRRSPSASPPRASASKKGPGAGAAKDDEDLDFALQLSLAEERSRREVEEQATGEDGRGEDAQEDGEGKKGKGKAAV